MPSFISTPVPTQMLPCNLLNIPLYLLTCKIKLRTSEFYIYFFFFFFVISCSFLPFNCLHFLQRIPHSLCFRIFGCETLTTCSYENCLLFSRICNLMTVIFKPSQRTLKPKMSTSLLERSLNSEKTPLTCLWAWSYELMWLSNSWCL